jgi:hypothetical protein
MLNPDTRNLKPETRNGIPRCLVLKILVIYGSNAGLRRSL